MARKALIAAVLGALVLAAAALGGTQLVGATTNVSVTAGKPSELRFTLSRTRVPRGMVVFRVTNRGKSRHDFKIAGKKTQLLAPGKTATLRVAIARAGRYAYLCTVPGHAAAGMKGTLRVT